MNNTFPCQHPELRDSPSSAPMYKLYASYARVLDLRQATMNMGAFNPGFRKTVPNALERGIC